MSQTYEYNHKHITTICPYCQGTNILQDPQHEETYCTRCGYILQDNTIIQITKEIEYDTRKVKLIRDTLWRKKTTSYNIKSSAISK